MQTPINKQNKDQESPWFQVYQCTRSGCGLRFTLQVGVVPQGNVKSGLCPVCRGMLETQGEPFSRLAVDLVQSNSSGTELEVLLDNIRSAWNVGSMLRTCDGAGVRRAHLCGITASPDNPKVAKTSLGAEKSMAWSFCPDGVAAARVLKEQGMRLWALEGGSQAVSLFDCTAGLPGPPIVLAAGNELSGVDPGILDLCERVVCLPMQGVKGSLNVAVAFGIAVYTIRFAGSDGGSR